jgi:hypothetical protein
VDLACSASECYSASMIIDLRRATEEHYQFALELYLSTMRPYTEELMVWDEAKQRGSFAAQWASKRCRSLPSTG